MRKRYSFRRALNIMHSVIIFGGSRGIGRLIADYLVQNGNEVSVAGRDGSVLAGFKKSIAKQNLNINTIKADVVIEKEVIRAFNAHKKEWGKNPDVVINCAAIQGPIGNSWTIPVCKWEKVIRINLLGSFIVSKIAVKQMAKSGYGSIIMFSGGGAAYGRANFSAYGVSKTGVLRMIETIAEELKLAGYPNIIINAVAPGAAKTRMTEEVIKAGLKAGGKALEEAADTFRTGGTSLKQITDLIDFLIDPKANCGLTGRLIHVREDYRLLIEKFRANVPNEIGKIRRIPIN